MKKYLNLKTLILTISIFIILAGVITICFNGFEKSIEYKAGTRIEIYIPNGYEKDEVIAIAKECFNTDEILFSKIEKLNQVAGIKINEYSKEQLENYINKIIEKYNIDEEEKEYHEVVVPETKLIDIIKPYILPIMLITILSIIYIMAVNYKSNSKVKLLLKTLWILVITISLYFSVIALLRLEFSTYTMPLALAIYIVTLLSIVNKK